MILDLKYTEISDIRKLLQDRRLVLWKNVSRLLKPKYQKDAKLNLECFREFEAENNPFRENGRISNILVKIEKIEDECWEALNGK